MARVLVVGAGLSGLSVAMEASVRGHHVVVLEKRPSIGGRASSESRDGFPIGYGPHFLLEERPIASIGSKSEQGQTVRFAIAPPSSRNSRARYDATP